MINLFNSFQQFMHNPMQYMIQSKLNIPQQYMNDPNQAIQYLMNTGKLTQDQYNWAVKQSRNLQNNPQFHDFFTKNGIKM